jgi:hypothetical protein
MKKILLFIITFYFIIPCTAIMAQTNIEGLWGDDARHFPTNPQEFASISKLNDGRFFVLLCRSTRDNKPIWQVSIGAIKDSILYVKFSDGEWRFKLGHDETGVEYLMMGDVPSSNMQIPFVRVSSEPIKKLEGTVRGEAFTK